MGRVKYLPRIVQPGVELAVDPTFLAARVCLRPLDYAQLGQVLGHYRTSFSTSAALWAANAILAAFRWGDASRFCVIERITASVTVVTAITAQRTDPLTVTFQRGYTANESTNATAIVLSGNSQRMRTSMSTSLVSSSGGLFAASAAAGLSGGTRTADANPFGQMGLSGLTTIGSGEANTDLFIWQIGPEHPPVLAQNEGFTIAWGPTALATGTATVNITVEWAEVALF